MNSSSVWKRYLADIWVKAIFPYFLSFLNYTKLPKYGEAVEKYLADIWMSFLNKFQEDLANKEKSTEGILNFALVAQKK